MNEEAKEAILLKCLDDMEDGVSVDVILGRYPEHAREIWPIL